MSKIHDPSRPPRITNGNQCVACQVKEGEPKYGIYLCSKCDDEIFVKPYGGHSDPSEICSSISLRVTKPHPKYDSLEVFYRFDRWNTLISAKQGTRSFPLLVLQGIKPMTQEFLDEVADKIDLWMTFS